MSKTLKIYLFALFLILGLIVFIDVTKPRPINWQPTYSTKDKIPYGLYVLNNEMPHIFENEKIKINIIDQKTIYEALTIDFDTVIEERYNEDTFEYDEVKKLIDKNGNELMPDDTLIKSLDTWLYINKYFEIDDRSVKALIAHVKNGGNAFLSAESFPEFLLDSLKLYEDFQYTQTDTLQLKFNHVNQATPLVYGLHGSYFKFKKGFKGHVKGYYLNSKNKQLAYFVKIPYGNGFFYLHFFPAMFTNINLLKDNNFQHAEICLSNLPIKNINWYLKNKTGIEVSNHPLRFIKQHPALKNTWQLGWLLVFIFLIFSVKRRQRIVPIIPPVKNTTVDFTKTIGNLYFQEKDYHDLMTKKITFFLEKLRSDFLIDTSTLDEVFVKRFQAKSGKPIEDVQKAVDLINKTRKSNLATEQDLVALNQAINKILD